MSPSTRTRRTISYFTCTRSRGSKNSEAAKLSSLTASGRGFRLRWARNASTFGSRFSALATPDLRIESHVCKYDYAGLDALVKDLKRECLGNLNVYSAPSWPLAAHDTGDGRIRLT